MSPAFGGRWPSTCTAPTCRGSPPPASGSAASSPTTPSGATPSSTTSRSAPTIPRSSTLPARSTAPSASTTPPPSTEVIPTASVSLRSALCGADCFRIGGFLMDTSKLVLTAKLALPPWLMPMLDATPETSIGACLLTNVRLGIWIADMHMVRCPVCNNNNCEGTMQVLDARHCELYLESKFTDGTWEYEDLGSHFSDGQVDTAAAAIINRDHIDTPHVKNILNAKSCIRGRSNLLPRAYLTPVAVALNTNLVPNSGLWSRFQAMRDATRGGQIVSIRITQQLL